MVIGVDARTLLDKQYSGVPEYTSKLLQALLVADSTDEFRLFTNSFKSDNIARLDKWKLEVKATRYPNKLFNFVLQKLFKYPKLDTLLENPKGKLELFFAPHINFTSLSGKVPSILTIHDLSYLRYPEFFSLRKNLWHRIIDVKRLAGQFNCLVAVSENTKQDIVELLAVPEEKVKVIYSGVNEEYRVIEAGALELQEVKEKYSLPDKYILSLGTIEPRKNPVAIIQAFDQLLTAHPELQEYHLVFTGREGWLTDEVDEALSQVKFRAQISFIGFVPSSDKPALYNLASLFVYPSFYEGFGFPPLEAMACGVSVITSAASSLPEVVGSAAVLVDAYDQNSLVRAMEQVLGDEALAAKLRGEGLAQAKKFSWQKTAGEYLSLFNELTNKTKS